MTWSGCVIPGATHPVISSKHSTRIQLRSGPSSWARHRIPCSGPGDAEHGSGHNTPDGFNDHQVTSGLPTPVKTSSTSTKRNLHGAAGQKKGDQGDKRSARRSCPANLAVASSLTLSTALALSGEDVVGASLRLSMRPICLLQRGMAT